MTVELGQIVVTGLRGSAHALLAVDLEVRYRKYTEL